MPDKAFMSAVPFSSHEADQPQTGTFLLRMSGSFYHPGGASKLFITSAPANAVAAIYMDGKVLETGDFNLPEGNHILDVRYGAEICNVKLCFHVAETAGDVHMSLVVPVTSQNIYAKWLDPVSGWDRL